MGIQFCGVDRTRKHRVHQWINTESLEPMFGIEANLAYGKWAHVAVPSGDNPKVAVPLLFESRAAAKAWIKYPPHPLLTP